jgi:hypothetical protein
MSAHTRLHALRHESLGLGNNHAILFGEQVVGRNIQPKWATDWHRDAGGRDRALDCGQYRLLFRRGVLRKRSSECLSR